MSAAAGIHPQRKLELLLSCRVTLHEYEILQLD